LRDNDSKPLVLIADDDAVTRAMVRSWLDDSGYDVISANDGDEALSLATEHKPDLLLVDVTMPGQDGYEVCRAIQEAGGTPPPVIFLTAHTDTAARVTGLDAGAVDYIVKPFDHEELIARVRAALRTKAVHDRLVDDAVHDGLTGLLNRRALDTRAEAAIAFARRHGDPISCLLLDLDHFKQINDSYGHATGDGVLREAARRLSTPCRASDVIGRYGGEEFLLLLPEARAEGAVNTAERLRAVIAEPQFQVGEVCLDVRASIGVAEWSPEMTTPASLYAAADRALYEAKKLGRNRTELFRPRAVHAAA
jgi:two-component system, cell cycle response regulator